MITLLKISYLCALKELIKYVSTCFVFSTKSNLTYENELAPTYNADEIA